MKDARAGEGEAGKREVLTHWVIFYPFLGSMGACGQRVEFGLTLPLAFRISSLLEALWVWRGAGESMKSYL